MNNAQTFLFSPTLTRTTLLALALGGLAMACEGDKSTTAPSDTPAPSGEAEATGVDTTTPWADLGPDARMARMKHVVMPAAKTLFGKPDANCTICHGPGAKVGDFTMPTEALPALDPTNNFAAHDTGAVKFMMEKVVPEVAGSLVTQPYDPESGTGFGCFSCHTNKAG